MTELHPTVSTPAWRSPAARLWLVVFGLLVAVYLPTASRSLPYPIDSLTNAVTGWYLANTGSPVAAEHGHLTGSDAFGNLIWLVDSPRGAVSTYPPGASLASVPFYFVAGSDLTDMRVIGNNHPERGYFDMPMPNVLPATIAAVVTTAMAGATLAVAFSRLGGRREAVIGALLFGIGTSAWSVAADALWQHGPAMLWVSLMLLAATSERWWLVGLAGAAAVLTRPHLAVIAAGIGLAAARGRGWRPVIAVGIPSTLGLGALLAYNWWIFDTVTLSGGYGSSFTERAVDLDLWGYAKNLIGAAFDPAHGLFLWAPFLLVLFAGIGSVWRSAPGWALGAAIGGVVYLLIQYKANRFSGGGGHFSYRYPLEAITAASPLLFLSATRWAMATRRRLVYLGATSLAAAVGQAIGAVSESAGPPGI